MKHSLIASHTNKKTRFETKLKKTDLGKKLLNKKVRIMDPVNDQNIDPAWPMDPGMVQLIDDVQGMNLHSGIDLLRNLL